MKTYHYVQVTKDGGNNLLSSDLVINNLERAQAIFQTKIKELRPGISQAELDDALDEGHFEYEGTVVLYVEPMNIYSKAGEDL